jgi:hypothetical protein
LAAKMRTKTNAKITTVGTTPDKIKEVVSMSNNIFKIMFVLLF